MRNKDLFKNKKMFQIEENKNMIHCIMLKVKILN